MTKFNHCFTTWSPSLFSYLRWPNTVFTRAFADVIQHVHKDCKNKHVVNRAIILFIQNPHYLRYFSLLLNAVYWWLYSVIKKDMLGKVTTQRTQKFLDFLCYRKNPVKCSACTVARKIETECFCRNLPISNDPVVRISRNLEKNSSEIAWMIYHKKTEIWNMEFLIIQNTIYGELRKSPMSKFC